MKHKQGKTSNRARQIALACLLAGSLCWGAANTGQAQTQPANLSPDLQQVVKLSQARMGDGVIISYLKSTGKSYQLGADDIIYLSSQGVSQNVIGAIQAAVAPTPAAPPPMAPVPVAPAPQPPDIQPAPAPAPEQQAPTPEPAVSLESFQNQLAPYGNWIQTPDGPVWHPAVEAGWRPYYDGGHWIMTDAGWYWQSDLTWGDITFHYGRWSYNPDYGWVWTPGYDFAPAWVCWRHADDDGYCGWAPLPPGALFVDGGWRYHDAAVAVDFDFGLSMGFFTFVDYGHFWEHDYRGFIVPRDRMRYIWGRSVFANRYRYDHGRFYNDGLDRERMAHFTGREIHVENSRDIRSREIHDHVGQREADHQTIRNGGRIAAGGRMGGAGHEAGRGGEAGHGGEPARGGEAGHSNAEHPATASHSSGALAMPGHAGSASSGGAERSSSSGASGMPKTGESGGSSGAASSASHNTPTARPAAPSGGGKKKPN